MSKKNRNLPVRESANVKPFIKPAVNTESVNLSKEITMTTNTQTVPASIPASEPKMDEKITQEARQNDDVQKDIKEEGAFRKAYSYVGSKLSSLWKGTKKVAKHGWDKVVEVTTTREGASNFISKLGDKSLQLLMLGLGMAAVTALAMKLGIITAFVFLAALYVAFKAISMLVSKESFSTQLGFAPEVAPISAAA